MSNDATKLLGALFGALLVGGYVTGAMALGIAIIKNTSAPYGLAVFVGYVFTAVLFPAFLAMLASE